MSCDDYTRLVCVMIIYSLVYNTVLCSVCGLGIVYYCGLCLSYHLVNFY